MWLMIQPGLAAGVIDFSSDFSSLLIALVVFLWVMPGIVVAITLREILTLRRWPPAATLAVEEDRVAA